MLHAWPKQDLSSGVMLCCKSIAKGQLSLEQAEEVEHEVCPELPQART